MKKLLAILVLVLFITSQGQAKVKSKDINFPGNFYTTEIKSCKAMDYGTFSSNEAINKVEGLIGVAMSCFSLLWHDCDQVII